MKPPHLKTPILAAAALISAENAAGVEPYRLVTLDPAHFHAALIQKEMYPELSPRAAVYAPLGPDLIEHLKRIAQFNLRADSPTRWELEIHAAADYEQRMLQEKPGAIVVLSGRNSAKMDRILAALEAGMHVLADKPWTLASADVPRLAAALDAAERKGLVAYDIMTERYEITSIVARALAGEEAVFGRPESGAPRQPGAYLRSVHNIMKTVAGVPSLRPAPFFDIREQGEALADVGTHLADLAQWTLFPEQAIDYRADIRLLEASHWPTVLTESDFRRVTGLDGFPAALSPWVKGGKLEYMCNDSVTYLLRGVTVKLDVLWDYQAPPGAGDVYEAVFRGSRCRLEIRQGKPENFRPELYVVPAPGQRAETVAALKRVLAARFPDCTAKDLGAELRIHIPDKHRVGHEAHFAQVARQFFEYLKSPRSMPAWEKPNMAAKYWVTTRGVEMAASSRPPGARLDPAL